MPSINTYQVMREQAARQAAQYIKDTYSEHAFEEFYKEFNLQNAKEEAVNRLRTVFMAGYVNGANAAMREVIVNGSFHSEGGRVPT